MATKQEVYNTDPMLWRNFVDGTERENYEGTDQGRALQDLEQRRINRILSALEVLERDPSTVPYDRFESDLDKGQIYDFFESGGLDASRLIPDINDTAEFSSYTGGAAPVNETVRLLESGEVSSLEELESKYPDVHSSLMDYYEGVGGEVNDLDENADELANGDSDLLADNLEENQTDPSIDTDVDLPPLLPGQGIVDKATDAVTGVVDKAKDAIPRDPKEFGDLIRAILEGGGVGLPNADPESILDGGFGGRYEFPAGTFNPNDIIVQVPGVPVGGPPNSVDIGTIGEIINSPGEVFDNAIDNIKDVLTDPTKIVTGAISAGTDLPPDLIKAILAGTYGQDVLDWLKGKIDNVENSIDPPISGETEEETTEPTSPPETAGGETTQEGDLTVNGIDPRNEKQETVQDPFTFGHENSDNPEELTTEVTFSGSDDHFIYGDPNNAQEENYLSGASGAFSGGGGGGAFDPSGVQLGSLGDPQLLARSEFPITDFLAGIFTGIRR